MPVSDRGEATLIPGGWRIVFEIADPSAGSGVDWFDMTCQVAGWQNVPAAPTSTPAATGRRSSTSTCTATTTYAPWNPDTSGLFGVHVDLGPGLMLPRRFHPCRRRHVVVDWLAGFTNRVERWGDATYARGEIRRFPIIARRPADRSGRWSRSPPRAKELVRARRLHPDPGRLAVRSTVYGATFDTGVDVVRPSRPGPAQTLGVERARGDVDPAGLCDFTDRTGSLIIRPPKCGTRSNQDAFTAGADGTRSATRPRCISITSPIDDADGILDYAA